LISKPSVVRKSVDSPSGDVDEPVVERVLAERGPAAELRVLGGRGGEVVLDAVDERAALLGLAERGGDQLDLLVPGREVVRRAPPRGDRRREPRELLVVGALHPRVHAEDEVGPERGDPLELEAVARVQDGRLDGGRQRPGRTTFGLQPRPDPRRSRERDQHEDRNQTPHS